MLNLLKNNIKLIHQIIFHILRYHNKININYNLKKNPDFQNIKSNNFFLNMLKKSKFFFEYGSGSSTILANRLLKKYMSIESDKNFFLYMKNINIPNIKFINFGYVYFYSVPIFLKINKKKSSENAYNYANQIFKTKLKPDLILIDGRYRVLCALTVFEFIKKKKIKNKDVTIILDDYKTRKKKYNVLKNFFYISLIGRFAILKPKNYFPNLEKIKEIYKYRME
jgi:hypothetical protein